MQTIYTVRNVDVVVKLTNFKIASKHCSSKNSENEKAVKNTVRIVHNKAKNKYNNKTNK